MVEGIFKAVLLDAKSCLSDSDVVGLPGRKYQPALLGQSSRDIWGQSKNSNTHSALQTRSSQVCLAKLDRSRVQV